MLLHAKKKETEQQTYPLWLVHVLMASLKGEEIIPIEQLLGSKLNEKTTTKSNEEMTKEYSAIVEEYKKKGR